MEYTCERCQMDIEHYNVITTCLQGKWVKLEVCDYCYKEMREGTHDGKN